MERTSDIIVIGAGIVGAMLAYRLACEGRTVRLIDRGQPGGEASGAKAGLLTTVAEGSGKGPYLDLSVQGLVEIRKTIEELQAETGIDCWLERHPLYRVATNEQEREMMVDKWQGLREQGGMDEWLEAEDLFREQPVFSRRLTGAIRSREEYHVTPARLMEAVVAALHKCGVMLQTNTDIVSLLTEGQRVVGVESTHERYYADEVVLANGAWSPELLKPLGFALPVTPLRGQMIGISLPDFTLPCLINTARGYLVPKQDGHIVVGATQENAEFEKEITLLGLSHLLRVLSVIPELGPSKLCYTFVGLRPMSKDGMPLLGPLPGWEGIHVTTGHAQHGILLSGITAKMMSAALNGQDPGDLWSHFQVTRLFASQK
jgi:glycine oxidase